MISTLPFDFNSLQQAYAGGVTPQTVVEEVFRRITDAKDPGIFILLRAIEEVLVDAKNLGEWSPDKVLWGLPYCVKDNIDVAGMATTAACPDFTYTAQEDATCVAHLRNAGALLIGKTNLDQFATGLVGVRTPYPFPKNAIDPAIVPGGSSSGSAVAVARGLVSFSLGTDTAGSGRVPASLNNIVGLKPTLGAVSAAGVVPACKTLDTVSIFAFTVDDGYAVAKTIAAKDEKYPYSRDIKLQTLSSVPPEFKVGAPSQPTIRLDGDTHQAEMFTKA